MVRKIFTDYGELASEKKKRNILNEEGNDHRFLNGKINKFQLDQVRLRGSLNS